MNGKPVAFTPTMSRTRSSPSSSQTRASTNGLATLMMVNSVVASPAVNVRPEVPTTAIPKRSGSTPWSAGYTLDGTPSR